MRDLTGRRAVVTGASQGIGAAAAIALAGAGANVAFNYRSATAEAEKTVFLASDASRYMTGVELIVDGGMVLNGNVGHART